MSNEAHILWFDAISAGDVKLVGGKNASLGEMIAHLKDQGVRVPEGFATTASAYWDYIAANKIGAKLRDRLEALTAGKASLQEVGADIRRLFLEGEFPEPIANAINQSYWELSRRAGVEAGCGGAQQRDRRGSARRELRRAAGDLPQHPRRARHCSMPAGAATPRSSPTGPSATARSRASTI